MSAAISNTRTAKSEDTTSSHSADSSVACGRWGPGLAPLPVGRDLNPGND